MLKKGLLFKVVALLTTQFYFVTFVATAAPIQLSSFDTYTAQLSTQVALKAHSQDITERVTNIRKRASLAAVSFPILAPLAVELATPQFALTQSPATRIQSTTVQQTSQIATNSTINTLMYSQLLSASNSFEDEGSMTGFEIDNVTSLQASLYALESWGNRRKTFAETEPEEVRSGIERDVVLLARGEVSEASDLARLQAGLYVLENWRKMFKETEPEEVRSGIQRDVVAVARGEVSEAGESVSLQAGFYVLENWRKMFKETEPEEMRSGIERDVVLLARGEVSEASDLARLQAGLYVLENWRKMFKETEPEEVRSGIERDVVLLARGEVSEASDLARLQAGFYVLENWRKMFKETEPEEVRSGIQRDVVAVARGEVSEAGESVSLQAGFYVLENWRKMFEETESEEMRSGIERDVVLLARGEVPGASDFARLQAGFYVLENWRKMFEETESEEVRSEIERYVVLSANKLTFDPETNEIISGVSPLKLIITLKYGTLTNEQVEKAREALKQEFELGGLKNNAVLLVEYIVVIGHTRDQKAALEQIKEIENIEERIHALLKIVRLGSDGTPPEIVEEILLDLGEAVFQETSKYYNQKDILEALVQYSPDETIRGRAEEQLWNIFVNDAFLGGGSLVLAVFAAVVIGLFRKSNRNKAHLITLLLSLGVLPALHGKDQKWIQETAAELGVTAELTHQEISNSEKLKQFFFYLRSEGIDTQGVIAMFDFKRQVEANHNLNVEFEVGVDEYVLNNSRDSDGRINYGVLFMLAFVIPAYRFRFSSEIAQMNEPPTFRVIGSGVVPVVDIKASTIAFPVAAVRDEFRLLQSLSVFGASIDLPTLDLFRLSTSTSTPQRKPVEKTKPRKVSTISNLAVLSAA